MGSQKVWLYHTVITEPTLAAKGVAVYKVALGTRTPLETPVELPDDFAFACRMKMRDEYEVWVRRSLNVLRGCARSCTSIIGFFGNIRTEIFIVPR